MGKASISFSEVRSIIMLQKLTSSDNIRVSFL
jgi:hypothetical protein